MNLVFVPTVSKNMHFYTKQVERSTILILTIHFDLVQLDFKLHLTKPKLAFIEHNLGPDLV